MGKFVMKSKATKEAAKKATEKGGGFSRFEMKGKTARLLILPPTAEDRPAVFTSVIHEQWKGGRPTAKVPSPAFLGQPDKITKMAWTIRDNYKDDKNEAKKNFFKKFLPKEQHFVNVLDLDDVDAGPQVYQMSGAVAEVVLDEINENEDLTSICDFDQGRILSVKHNGKKGLQRRYKAKFLSETANLIEDGILDDAALDEIANDMYDLRKLQPKFDEEAFESYYEKLLKLAEKAGIEVDVAVSDDEDDWEEEGEESGDDDEFEEDSGDDGDDDDFEEEEEKPAKGKAKPASKGKAKPAKSDDDDDDFDDDSDEDLDFEDESEEEGEEESGDDDDFDFDDEEEEEVKKPAKAKPASKPSSNRSKPQPSKKVRRRG